MSPIKVILADDHVIIRDGIASLLSYNDEVEVIEQCDNGEQAIDAVKKHDPDVVLMDINMPILNGIEATRKIVDFTSKTKVLVLTIHEELAYITKVLSAGAMGYILKTADKNELILAIRTVHNGEKYFSKEVADTLVSGFMKQTRTPKDQSVGDLTKREKEILNLISKAFTNNEIGEELFISVRTVDTHRRNLLQKLGAKNTAGLVRFAIENNLSD